jgi:hypothetical protein
MGNTKSSKEKSNKDDYLSDNSDTLAIRKYSNNNIEKLIKNSSLVSEKLSPTSKTSKLKRINRSKFIKLLDGELQINKRNNVCNFLVTSIMTKAINANHKKSCLEKRLSLLDINTENLNVDYLKELEIHFKVNEYYNILNYSIVNNLNISQFSKDMKEKKPSFNIEKLNSVICENLKLGVKNFMKKLTSNGKLEQDINYITLLEKYFNSGDLSIDNSIDNINFIGDSSLNQSRNSNYTELNVENFNVSQKVYKKKKDISKNINSSLLIKGNENTNKVNSTITKDNHTAKDERKKSKKKAYDPLIKIYVDLRPFLKKNDEVN